MVGQWSRGPSASTKFFTGKNCLALAGRCLQKAGVFCISGAVLPAACRGKISEVTHRRRGRPQRADVEGASHLLSHGDSIKTSSSCCQASSKLTVPCSGEIQLKLKWERLVSSGELHRQCSACCSRVCLGLSLVPLLSCPSPGPPLPCPSSGSSDAVGQRLLCSR